MLCESSGVGEHANSKIRKARTGSPVLGFADQDVCGLEVLVQDADGMCGRECIGDPCDEVQADLQGELLGAALRADPFSQVALRDELAFEKIGRALELEVVQANDGGTPAESRPQEPEAGALAPKGRSRAG
jgi:hypothetical protein